MPFNQYFINMSTAVSNVFIPRVNRLVAEKQNNAVLDQLFIRIGRIQYMILSAVLVGYLLYGKFFISKWAGDGYESAYYVGALIMIPYIVPLIQNIGIEIQRAKNMHKFRSIIYFVIALANLGISIPLGKYFGAAGTAFGTTLSTVIGNIVLMNWYYEKKVGLNIALFFRNLIQPSVILGIAAVEGIIVKHFFAVHSWSAFLVQGALFMSVYAVLLYFFGMNNKEKDDVRHMLKRGAK